MQRTKECPYIDTAGRNPCKRRN